MPLPSGTSFLRTPIGRLAVTGAATLVTVVGIAPAAMAADDDLAPETSSTDSASTTTPDSESSDVQQSAAPEQEPPAEEVPAPEEEPPTEEVVPDEGEQAPEDTAPAEEPAETDPSQEEAEQLEDEAEPEVEAAAETELVLTDDTGTATAGRTGTFDVLANDRSTDAIESLTIESQGEHGQAYVVGNGYSSEFDPEPDGSFVPGAGDLRIEFDADEDYTGADSFTYRVTTLDGTTATATVDLQVEAYVAPPVNADFGTTKFRVGVQLADGSYAPQGTAGSVFRIQEIPLQGPTPDPFTCTTGSFSGLGSEYSECPAEYRDSDGSSFVITQVSAPDGVVPSTRRQVVEPCFSGGSTRFCGGLFGGGDTVVFTNTGSVLPVANDDTAVSRNGRPVDVDVLDDDDSEDPNTVLEVASQPDEGTAEVVGTAVETEPDTGGGFEPVEDRVGVLAVPNAGTQRIRYTPEPGFEGVDTFTYRLTNGNGSDTATVSVRVTDNGAVSPVDPTDPDDDVSDGSVAGSGSGRVLTAAAGLPSAGGPDVGLLALGGALLATGAVAVAGSRRRRDIAGG